MLKRLLKKNIKKIVKHGSKFCYVLVFGIVFLGVYYVYCLYGTVTNSALLNKVESEIVKLENENRELDNTYLSRTMGITPQILKTFNMTEGKVTAYISRTATLGRLSAQNSGL